MLPTVDEIGLWSVGNVADTRVPQEFAIGGIDGHEIATAIASED